MEGLQTQTLDQTDQTTGSVIANDLGELEEGIRPVDAWDRFKASVTLNVTDSPVGVPGLMPDDMLGGTFTRYLARKGAESDLESRGRAKITAEQANKQFPGMPAAFNEPIYPEIAQLQWEENKRKEKYREYISRGGGNGLWMELAAGAPTMLDPVNLLLSKGMGKIFGGASLRANFAENLAGNLAADVPSYGVLKSEGQNPRVIDTMLGSVGGAAFGTGLFAATRFAGNRMKRTQSKEANSKATTTAISQLEMNRKVEVSPIAQKSNLRRLGFMDDGSGVPKPGPSSLVEGAYFGAVDPDGNSISLLTHQGDDGVHLSDSHAVAQNAAAESSDIGDGGVIQYKLKEGVTLLDTAKSLEEEPKLQAAIQKSLGEQAKVIGIEKTDTIAEVIEKIEQFKESSAKEIGNPVKDAAVEAGYRGYSQAVEGEGVSRRGTYVFDKNDVEVMDGVVADKSALPQIEGEELKQLADDTMQEVRGRHYDVDAKKEIFDLESSKSGIQSASEEMVRSSESFADRVLKSKDSVESTVPKPQSDIKTELDRIAKESKAIEDEISAMKAFADCITQGLV